MAPLIVLAHVLLIVFAFGMLVFPGMATEWVARSRNVPNIRAASGAFMRLGRIGGPMVGIAGLIGLAAAWMLHYPLGESWLVVTYVCFIALVAMGVGVYSRWHNSVYTAAIASPDSAPSPQLAAILDHPISPAIHVSHMALWIVLFLLMVMKPHLW